MTSKTRRTQALYGKPVVELIEPRILYSADSGAVAYAPGESALVDVDVVDSVGQHDVAADAQGQTISNRLVVLDGSLPGLDLLVDDLTEQQASGAAIDWLLLDPREDGIDALTDFLATSELRYAELHIVTHGTAGQFELGASVVNTDSLRERAGDFSAWGESLSNDADLLIYGCDLTSTNAGQSLVSGLAALTSADIAASSDTTGHQTLQGDWDLESRQGAIEASTVFSEQSIAGWQSTLDLIPEVAPEQLLSQVTPGDYQELPDDVGGHQIASNANTTVVVWEDDDANDIHYRVFPTGDPNAGIEFEIQNDLGFGREDPVVAIGPTGDFVIVWTADGQDGAAGGVYAQRFNPDGTPKPRPADAQFDAAYSNSYEFRINLTDPGGNTAAALYDQYEPSVSMTSDGGFVVSWTSHDVLVPPPTQVNANNVAFARFDANGMRTVQVSYPVDITGLNMDQSVVASAPAADSTVLVSQIALVTLNDGLHIQTIDVNGAPLLAPGVTLAPTDAGTDFQHPAVAVNNNGQFVVAAEVDDGTSTTIFLWHIEADGTINYAKGLSGPGQQPDVAIRDDGSVYITWHAFGGVVEDVYVQELDNSGDITGFSIVANNTTQGSQIFPSIALVDNNTLSVAWSGRGPGDNNGVFSRTVDIVPPAVITTTSGNATTENGDTVSILVRLATPPIDPVTVTLNSSATGEGTVSPTSLTFNNSNWSTVQTATVTGVSDGVIDGDQVYSIGVSSDTSVDARYAALPPRLIALVNTDINLSQVADTDVTPNEIVENASPGAYTGVTAQASEVGHTVTYSLTSNPGNHFEIDLNGGGVTVAAGANIDYFTAQSHNITITATSTSGASESLPVTIQVIDVNDETPVINLTQNFPLAENPSVGALVGTVQATDVDTVGSFQNWTITGGTGAAFYAIDSATGQISVSDPSALDYETPANRNLTLNVTVSDGVQTSLPETVTVNLTDVNDNAPVVTPSQSFTFAENPAMGDPVGVVLATDADSVGSMQDWMITGGTGASAFAIDPITGQLTVTDPSVLDHEIPANRTLTLTVTVSDGVQTSLAETVTLNMTDVNDNKPVILPSQTFTVAEGSANGTSVGFVQWADDDTIQGPLNWAIIAGTGASNFTFNSGTNEIVVWGATALDLESQANFNLRVTATEGVLVSDSVLLNINLTNVNEAPVGGAITASAIEDTEYEFTGTQFVLNDPDSGDSLASIDILTLPAAGELRLDGVPIAASGLPLSVPLNVTAAQLLAGSLTYMPALNSNASVGFDVRLLDQGGLASPDSLVTVNISPVNDAPVFSFGPIELAELDENTAITGNAEATDADGDVITWAFSGPDVGNFVVDTSNGDISIVQPLDFENPVDANLDNDYEVQVLVTDPSGASDTLSLIIRIGNVVEPLNLSGPVSQNINEDVPLVLSGANGLSLSDEENSSLLTMSISVSNGVISLAQDTGLTFLEGDAVAEPQMTFEGSAAAVGAAISSIEFVPDTDFFGNGQILTTVTDPSIAGRSASAPIVITIAAQNDVPVVSGGQFISVPVGDVAPIDASVISATDVEDGPADLVYRVVSGPQSGTILLNGQPLASGQTFSQADLDAGLLSFTSTGGSSGTIADVMTLSVEDSGGAAVGNIDVTIEYQGGGFVTDGAGSGGSDSSNGPDDSDNTDDIDDSPGDADSPPATNSTTPPVPGDAGVGLGGVDDSSIAETSHINNEKAGFTSVGREYLSSAGTEYIGFRVSALESRADTPRDDGGRLNPTERRIDLRLTGDDWKRSINALEEEKDRGVVLERRFVASSVALSSGVTIGYVLWLLRGGALLSSVLASMPAWRSIDPLPVLSSLDSGEDGGAEDDSLEAMLREAKEPELEPAPEVIDAGAEPSR